MSYKADLQSNNVDLQSILATINALPEAGGGGVETCTVKFVKTTSRGYVYLRDVLSFNGEFEQLYYDNEPMLVLNIGSSGEYTLSNVVKGSILRCRFSAGIPSLTLDDNAEQVNIGSFSVDLRIKNDTVITFADID